MHDFKNLNTATNECGFCKLLHESVVYTYFVKVNECKDRILDVSVLHIPLIETNIIA